MNHRHVFRVFSLILAAVLMLSIPVSAGDYQGAEDAIRNGYASGAETIELEAYGLTIEKIEEIFSTLRNDNELPWYTDVFSYTYDLDTGIVKSLTPNNLDETEYDRDLYEQKVQQVLDEAVFPGMSQWQIALSVHDYFASHFYYDETYTNYEGYDLLVDGTAVCEGYARAYMDVLKRAGLEAIYATSDAMDHGWNLVKINGNWYHVDVTWDDPVSDTYGRVLHFYFLLDDGAISDAEHEHYSWETSQTASSTDMNSGVFWLETESAICYESASVSYIRMDESNEHWIYRRNEQTGELTELAYFDAGYIDVGYGSYHYQNYGLSLWNGRLYFSDMEHVYSMNTDGSDQTVVYSYDAEANGRFIRGSFVDDGVIYITLSDHNDNQTNLTVAVPGYTPHEHSYSEQRTEPTCTEDGYVKNVCSCGDSYRTQTLPATGHSYNNGTVTLQATETTAGEVTYTCTLCGESYTETIPALGTSENTEPAVPQFTFPSATGEVVEQEEKGGFPVMPVIIGVVILTAVLLMLKSGGKKKPKTGRSTSVDPYGGDVYDYGGDAYTDTSGEDYSDYTDYSDYSSETYDY